MILMDDRAPKDAPRISFDETKAVGANIKVIGVGGGGGKLTKGLGAGSNPDIGRQAALEDSEKIIEALQGADMVFITSGLGGGTGTGAVPIIASLASELGALVVAVVTKPFGFEGKKRRDQAEQGLRELQEAVDTVICIPNEKLLNSVDKAMPFVAACLGAHEVLRQADALAPDQNILERPLAGFI